MREGHPLKWQQGTGKGEARRRAKEDAMRTREKFDQWEGREKIVLGRGVSVVRNRFSGNEWGDGDFSPHCCGRRIVIGGKWLWARDRNARS